MSATRICAHCGRRRTVPAMALVIARGDFGKGDWFRAADREYKFRLY